MCLKNLKPSELKYVVYELIFYSSSAGILDMCFYFPYPKHLPGPFLKIF